MRKKIFLTGLLSGNFLFASHALAQSTTTEWLSYNNSLEGQRFSHLSEINTANASQLGEVCRVQIDGPASFHAGLIVSGGLIYTNTSRMTVAIDAQTCEVRWKYDYQPEDPRCGGSNRGLALQNGRLYRGTCDGRLIALDAATGKLLWKNVIAIPELGESTSAVPLAWQNLVFMGIGGSELGIRGRVMAYDAISGQELWRFHTIPMGEETGARTWKRPATAKTGGGGVWGAMSLDVTRGELYVPVGNPWPDIDRDYRPGDNLFTNSIVVLDARTGALKWWHQVSPTDWMDFDLAAAPVLYRGGGARDYVAIGGKDGYLTVVDRDTHQRVFQTPVTTVEHIHDKPTREGTRMCPGYAGGVEWNGPALDKTTGNLITGAVDIFFIVTLGKANYSAGRLDFGGTVTPDGEATGWITSVNSETGEVKWRYHAEKPVVAGITPTAGGVTFAGDLAGNFLVFESASGALLHKVNVGGAMAGGVITYAIDNRQYVALAAGNVSRNAFGDIGLPSVVIMTLNPEAPPRALDATMQDEQGIASGRLLFSQVCAACHGTDGNLVPNHPLGNLAEKMTLEDAVDYIKDPVITMPSLYPDLIDEQTVINVARYILEELN